MRIRRIKRITKLIFIVWTVISVICVASIFVWNPSNFVEYIISIISVAVTIILGVTTYLQSEIQLEIDNISKRPFCKIINFESVENYEEKGYQSYGLPSFPVKELLGIEMVIRPSMENQNLLTYYVPIELISEGDINILSINGYIYDEKKCRFIKNSNSSIVDNLYGNEMFKVNEPEAYQYVENLMSEWVIPTFFNVKNEGTESYSCTFKVELGDDFNSIVKKMQAGNLRFEYVFALEIVNIAGYTYTQLISIKLYPFAANVNALAANEFKVLCGLMNYQTIIMSKPISKITRKDIRHVLKMARPKYVDVNK